MVHLQKKVGTDLASDVSTPRYPAHGVVLAEVGRSRPPQAAPKSWPMLEVRELTKRYNSIVLRLVRNARHLPDSGRAARQLDLPGDRTRGSQGVPLRGEESDAGLCCRSAVPAAVPRLCGSVGLVDGDRAALVRVDALTR